MPDQEAGVDRCRNAGGDRPHGVGQLVPLGLVERQRRDAHGRPLDHDVEKREARAIPPRQRRGVIDDMARDIRQVYRAQNVCHGALRSTGCANRPRERLSSAGTGLDVAQRFANEFVPVGISRRQVAAAYADGCHDGRFTPGTLIAS